MEYTLVELAEALEQLERVEAYLEAAFGNLRLEGRQWYRLMVESVTVVRNGQDEARYKIAKRIYARLLN